MCGEQHLLCDLTALRLDLFQNRGEEAVTWLNAGQSAQVRAASQRDRIRPDQFALLVKLFQLSAAIDNEERRVFFRQPLDDIFVFFFFQRAGRIDQAASGSDLGHGRPKDRELPRLQITKILRCEPPFDFGIAGECPGAGAGHVCENAIESCGEGEIPRIGGNHADIAGFDLGL